MLCLFYDVSLSTGHDTVPKIKKTVSMTRICKNHILQTNPWHHKEESKNDKNDMISRTIKKYVTFVIIRFKIKVSFNEKAQVFAHI